MVIFEKSGRIKEQKIKEIQRIHRKIAANF